MEAIGICPMSSGRVQFYLSADIPFKTTDLHISIINGKVVIREAIISDEYKTKQTMLKNGHRVFTKKLTIPGGKYPLDEESDDSQLVFYLEDKL